jgi:hypothetical protein
MNTRTKRRLCSHPRWLPARRGRFEVCVECGDRFPCKSCEHLDCVEARKSAGSQEEWPEWTEEEGRVILSTGPMKTDATCACGLLVPECLGCA